MRKNSILVIFSFVLALAFSNANVFAGNPDYIGHWAENQIKEFIEKGYILGYPDGSFKPDKEITRAEFFALTNRVLGLKDKGDVAFTDVEKGLWYEDEIYNAVNAGYITGYGDGTVRPNDIINRVEVCKILAGLLKWDAHFEKEDFSCKDADDVPDWGKGDLICAIHHGFIKCSADNWVQPYKGVTRAEAVVLLYKAKVGEVDESVIPVTTAEGELTGILIDKHCFAFKEPEKDTVHCLKMKGCAASGYGVAVKQSDDNYIFYKFDEKGQEIAKSILDTTTKESNVVVLAKGVISGETIRITELVEK